MESVIIKPNNRILQKYVQYFLFFQKSDSQTLNYTTFPNNNLCLAIYKENRIDYTNTLGLNNCIITESGNTFSSRIYGFHKMPFQVKIDSALDQICIIFYPSALLAFTRSSFTDLMRSDSAADEILSKNNLFLLEEIFEEKELQKRAWKLEKLLLKKFQDTIPDRLKEALDLIDRSNLHQNLTVEMLSSQLGLSEPTLFRLFKNHLGQNPQSYLKTIRFRNALNTILHNKHSLTEVAYQNQYFDQAHFIHDFKSFSGYTPKQLLLNVSVQQDNLAWIYNKK